MSKVISFRLDTENKREQVALDVIIALQNRGFSLRQIMIEALLKFNIETNDGICEQMIQINKKLDQLSKLLDSINENKNMEEDDQRDSSEQELSRGFLEAVKITVKPGLRIGL